MRLGSVHFGMNKVGLWMTTVLRPVHLNDGAK